MTRPSRAVRVIADRKQVAVLTSAIRQEIVDTLGQLGAVSVSELAATLGRPPDALYYHLRLLVGAGLVREIRQSGNGRREARFRAVARQFRIDYKLDQRSYSDSMATVVASMLRVGIRDYRRALYSKGPVVEGASRELRAQRKTVWLTKQEIRRVNQLIEKLLAAGGPRRARARLFAITVLVTPVNLPRAAATKNVNARSRDFK